MSYGSKRWLPSFHHLGYMEATKSLKYPYYLTRDTCPSRAYSEIFVIAPSDGCPATANLVSIDASLGIPTRVLHFEVSGLRRRTPVKPVLLTGQTGTHRSDQSDPPVRSVWSCCTTVFNSLVSALWINQGT
jgi:hypothetical protein